MTTPRDERTCQEPRCHKPELAMSWPICFEHSLALAERQIAEAEALREWVLARRTGQLDLLDAS